MSAPAQSLTERKSQRESALAERRQHFVDAWLDIRADDPWAEFDPRRMFAIEILVHSPDLKPNAASFLGQACVDKNKFSARQSEWLTVLVDEFLGTKPPKAEPQSKKKSEAGK